MRELSSARLLGPGLLLALACACGHPHASTPPSTLSPLPALHQGPLTDYVPAAGLRWLLVGQPKVLAQNPELLSETNPLLSKERLDAFATSSGVELRALPEGCIAGFDYGTLYLARTGTDNDRVRKRFEARLVTDPIIRSSRKDLWRITGLVANTPESLLTVEHDFAAFAVGDPLLARIAEAFAVGRFRKSKPALAGAALATLPHDLSEAPLRFYAPGPFTDEWASAADGVLARALAIGASITLPSSSVLHVRVVISGAFGPDLEKTRSHLWSTWSHLQFSAIGHLLRLQDTLEPATITVLDDWATLDVSFPVTALMQGISAAVIDDVATLMGSAPTVGGHPENPK
jgi:hypothetical protein